MSSKKKAFKEEQSQALITPPDYLDRDDGTPLLGAPPPPTG